MRFTLFQLEAFYWVAKLGSVHGAARHLHLTQPAISSRLRELEAAMAMRLFDRKQQRLTLTDAGRRALAHAERVLGAGQELERFGHGEPAQRRVLRLGADESAAIVALPEILARLKALHPELRVELTVAVGTVLAEKLARRELDVALHSGQGLGEHVLHQLLGWIEFQWVAAPQMTLPDAPFTPADAARLPIVTHQAPSTLNSTVEAWLRHGGFDFSAYNACNSLWLMLRLTQIGHAIALLPVPIMREPLASGQLRLLHAQPPVPPAAYYISFLDEERGAWLGTLIAMIKEVLYELSFLVRPVSEPTPADSSV